MKPSSQLDADQGIGEREAAWEAQRRILVDDSERLRQSLHQVTRERDELGLKLAAVTGKSGAVGKTPPPSGGVSMADFMLERKAYEAEVGNRIISRDGGDPSGSLCLHCSFAIGRRAFAYSKLATRGVEIEG